MLERLMVEIVYRAVSRHIARPADSFDDRKHALPRCRVNCHSAGPDPLLRPGNTYSRSRSFDASNKQVNQRIDGIDFIEHAESEIEVGRLSKRLTDELAMLAF